MDDEVHQDYIMYHSGEEDSSATVAVRSRNHSSEDALTK